MHTHTHIHTPPVPLTHEADDADARGASSDRHPEDVSSPCAILRSLRRRGDCITI